MAPAIGVVGSNFRLNTTNWLRIICVDNGSHGLTIYPTLDHSKLAPKVLTCLLDKDPVGKICAGRLGPSNVESLVHFTSSSAWSNSWCFVYTESTSSVWFNYISQMSNNFLRYWSDSISCVRICLFLYICRFERCADVVTLQGLLLDYISVDAHFGAHFEFGAQWVAADTASLRLTLLVPWRKYLHWPYSRKWIQKYYTTHCCSLVWPLYIPIFCEIQGLQIQSTTA